MATKKRRLVTVTVRLAGADVAWLDSRAAGRGEGVKRSDIIREAVRDYKTAALFEDDPVRARKAAGMTP